MNLLTQFLGGLLMTATTLTQAANTDIIRSINDNRHYDYTVLDNGLKLLVVSDPDAQRAAAGVDVNVGTSAEPDAFPGLAHFLEHMLFLGTDHYPDPDDYINYISEHGGNHNAFTAFDHTNYFFDIDPKYLHEGLKRFSRFFVAPTLSDKYVERERNAVDSEYQSKLREDAWRNMDVLKQAVNPRHPYSRFSIGNNTTLPNDTVRDALLTFYEDYYSADRMSAVIIGKENTKTLMQWGKALFADVPKRPAQNTDIPEKLFDNVGLPIEIRNQSIKNEKNLSLYFQFPYLTDNEYSKSLGYLSYILGYEGEGSLLSALKHLGYATELYSGAGYRIGDETSFEIGIQLTDKGYADTNSVLAVVFAYIELLREDKQGQARYQEIATVSQTGFDFKEKRSAIHEASALSTRLNRYPVDVVQSLNATFSGYNVEQIQSYVSKMTPTNVVVQITEPDLTATQKTQYFNVPYQVTALDVSEMTHVAESDKAVVAQMHLPNANPFIAKNYALQASETAEKTITLPSGITVYYYHNTTFNVPRSSVRIALQPQLELSIADKTAMHLLADWIDEKLTTTLYDADIAGLHADIAAGEKSLTISLSGYSEKMPELLDIILNTLKTLSPDEPTFTRVKQAYQQDLENTDAQSPYQQTFAHLNDALVTDASLPKERLAALLPMTEAQVLAFADKTLKKMAVRMLVYGNHTQAQATALADQVSTVLDKTDFQASWHNNTASVLNAHHRQDLSVKHADNAITYYIQGEAGYTARAEIGLLAQLIEPQFFTQLRTEKQLGYVVFAYPRPSFNQSGIGFTIQSPVADPAALEKHIVEFNQAFARSLADISEAEFSAAKQILVNSLRQKPENLGSAAGEYWADLMTTDQTASSKIAIADAVETLSREAFVKKMQQLLGSAPVVVISAIPAL